MVDEAYRLKSKLNRNYIPGHKKGGSVSHFTILKHAPVLLGLYQSNYFLEFINGLVNQELMHCPSNDPHACALYYYTEEGDHMGFHYDTSYYQGARYTVLLGLANESSSCQLPFINDPFVTI